ncbi:gamma-glutamylcyclotransferase family protein [Brevibacillus massiliensis]|uniref:gamma-glutamylcyclotransferase family protein n=1 Tax=Brevibacillus massiliensis TaxID=1118054 RepID=UPI0003101583|nr:gamma-glutamylcyclotransferase family protein [Brevibacillus massiliensis]
MIWVFVYGTLLPGECNHHVVKPYLIQTEPGRVRGRLYDIGAYPALVLDETGDWVEGEWHGISAEGLKDLDELEGYSGEGQSNEYDRVWVEDREANRAGWVYVYGDSRGYPPIPGGSWRQWRKRT